jgi:hypothetical protein
MKAVPRPRMLRPLRFRAWRDEVARPGLLGEQHHRHGNTARPEIISGKSTVKNPPEPHLYRGQAQTKIQTAGEDDEHDGPLESGEIVLLDEGRQTPP